MARQMPRYESGQPRLIPEWPVPRAFRSRLGPEWITLCPGGIVSCELHISHSHAEAIQVALTTRCEARAHAAV